MLAPAALPSQSGRTVLVRPQEEDDAAVAALRSHPETRRYLPFLPEHFSVEDAHAQRLARAADETRIPFHIHLSTPPDSESPTKFVGIVGITHIDAEFRSCEIGILIRPDCVRGGLATDALATLLAYAFEEKKFHRVVFVTAVHNVGMRGWLDKAGATLEVIQRESCSDGMGGYIDMCVYSILEEEWVSTVKLRLEERIGRQTA
ncbi:Ribosomal-protein-alanine acetyltransferase [Mycena venus]|uniref:Ribosomal-protein-alanine acetyltransferase n=1 Tax=Mycena venus TaxID=2733690 RepID=A0A8H7D5M6_9AGAR|nr:Ribosomal-protein-alanine acetyltransferase [Mycena venus]